MATISFTSMAGWGLEPVIFFCPVELADISHVRALRAPRRAGGVGVACLVDVHLRETVDGHGGSDGLNLRVQEHCPILTDVDH
jgi:hypothetical protein